MVTRLSRANSRFRTRFFELGVSNRPDDDQGQVATIGSMYIRPEFWGKGIGRRLMAIVLETAKSHDFTEATLHVLASNNRAKGQISEKSSRETTR